MTQTRWIVVSVLLLFSVCVLLSSCSKKDKPTAPKITAEASASIGPEGGIVEVSNSSSSLYGVKVEIPKGALEETKTINISVGPDDLPAPQGMVKASKSVLLEPESLVFNAPVTISIPYHEEKIDEQTALIYRYDPNKLSWEITQLKEIDTVSNLISTYAYTFSIYQTLALQIGASLPPESNLDFDPSEDRLNTAMNVHDCYGEVAFVQWFWKHKKSDALHLTNWHGDEHFEIANMAQKVTWRENRTTPANIWKDDLVAYSLMTGLTFPVTAKPQIVLLIFPERAHAVLVYNYKTRDDGIIEFYVYDPANSSKYDIMTYDGTSLTFLTYQDAKFQFVGSVQYAQTIEFVYEYFNDPPTITEITPTGEITNRRPILSAKIHYPFISQHRVSMSLNHDDLKPLDYHELDAHNAIVSYKVQKDLSNGEYQVDVEGSSYISKCDPSSNSIPAVKTSWTFTVSSSSTGDIVGTWDLVRIVSVRDDGETYEVPSEEIQEDPLTYIFNSDHTAIQIYQGDTATFSWNLSGNKLITDDMTYTFTVNSTTLTLTFQVMDEGRTYTITHYFSRR
jgi:hypothetical protein